MKFTWVASALASILMLYGNDTFAINILNKVDELNHDQDKSQGSDLVSRVQFEGGIESKKNSEDHGYVTLVNYIPRSVGRAVVSGQAISYISSSLDKLIIGSNTRGSNASNSTFGMNYDALLRLGAEIRSNSSGIKYGVDFQVCVPSVQGQHFGKKAALNRGSRIFAATPYGDFSIGYQEGVESLMKLDASGIVAGDDSNSWTHYIKGMLAEEKNSLGYLMYPFLFSAGLYSENVFRNNDSVVLNGSYKGNDFINNLPLRLSYQSPSYMGFRFGVSYSPTGYDSNLFNSKFSNFNKFDEFKGEFKKGGGIDGVVYPITSGMMQVNEDNTHRNPQFASVVQHPGDNNILFGAKYEHILSGSIAYDYDLNNGMKFSTAIVGEYSYPSLYFNTESYNIYPGSHSLQGISIGSVISTDNFNFAAASGYLGKSGFVKEYYYKDKIYPLHERSNTYYWDVALGYRYKSYYVSIAYFESNRSGNVLRDIGLGFEYNLLKQHSKMKCKLFGNYHYYNFSETAIVDKVVYNHEKVIYLRDGLNALQGLGYNTRAKEEKLKKGAGTVLLVGVKLEF
ncbi:hypothetical protein EDL79_02825 [Ehrlichia ruminantium]|uniref:Porin domain-containing protein n=1 Tax=Ehrlichia ruminantium TaxID=779 RepID=A0AAE6QAJ5_EHRRU|nr:hypothetical protein [Ehrlichia ruminantium]QGR02567.1 hypothetical protein EDL81_02815 [Ehrlichia ruminantium]QGR03487.1 hypothetical protein EDL80_02815 [Ehrlichia ruminantium]QGR04412.1 hypothetical protein EDL79_02825 [Ehrlichia ruminantium]